MTNKEIVFILNTHMPYVLTDGPVFQEKENWLFEAITETYIPLFKALEQWHPETQPGKKIIFSMTPCLFNQLVEGKERYLAYLDIMEKIGEYEIDRTASAYEYSRFLNHKTAVSEEQLSIANNMAHYYLERIRDSRDFWEELDLVSYLNKLFDTHSAGIEAWTSSPYHNFLPFFEEKTVDHFIGQGKRAFEKVFNRSPDGFWMPECAYFPGTEKSMIRHGIGATALTVPGIGAFTGTDKSGRYRHKGIDIYSHDYRLAMYLWKAPDTTFPSDGSYREFYRDIGLDVSQDYFDHIDVKVYRGKSGLAWTGYKYFSVTGEGVDLGDKQLYDLKAAKSKVGDQIKEFDRILEKNRGLSNDDRAFILAFDTELFGHWWHEGIDWLSCLLQYDLTTNK
jgi:1,4-alpha-glucan branching enzyme